MIILTQMCNFQYLRVCSKAIINGGHRVCQTYCSNSRTIWRLDAVKSQEGTIPRRKIQC